MPHSTYEPHTWWTQRIVFWEFEFGREYATFIRGALGSLDERLPGEYVLFTDRAGCDAVWWIRRQVLVFVEETFGSY